MIKDLIIKIKTMPIKELKTLLKSNGVKFINENKRG